MPLLAIPYPAIDPVLIDIGPFPIRWYALAYVFGLILGWLYARWIVRRDGFWGATPRPTAASLDDLLVYTALGVILGGRIGYVLFYNFGYYLTHPAEVIAVWKGGMSFHGGLAGASLAIVVFARRNQVKALSVADIVACTVPIGLLLGRIANFIKPELWGRVSDVPWAMVFPDAGPLPRHPSQLYEAGLEGLVILVLMHGAMRVGVLMRPGLAAGIFGIAYGLARIACEFFREPDPQLGFLFGGATMGMLLSLPVIAAGVVLIVAARWQPRASP
ncbi:MAG: prolipoprotein diacylglyceryl transferase [Methylobacteriaceae bacterium]|nr:prolipoprotein diacylglyceryl transferase [Methylobacteriaceae bacterium]